MASNMPHPSLSDASCGTSYPVYHVMRPDNNDGTFPFPKARLQPRSHLSGPSCNTSSRVMGDACILLGSIFDVVKVLQCTEVRGLRVPSCS
jgi:hypothetical protein